MKKIIVLIACLVLIGVLVGLYFYFTSETNAVLVASENKIFDGTYIEMCLKGLQDSKDVVVPSYIDVDSSTYEARVAKAINENKANVIISAESSAKNKTEALANKYTNKTFINLDTFYDTSAKNLVGISFNVYKASYLAGYVAARTSKTGKIGFIGGMDADVINEFKLGFIDGAKKANSKIEITTEYVNSYNDKAQGKLIADKMYGNNIDVIFQAAGESGLGVIEGAVNNDKYVIGVDYDQTSLAPKNVLTNVIKRADIAIKNVLTDYTKNTLQSNYVFDLQSKIVDITEGENIASDILNEVKALRNELTK